MDLLDRWAARRLKQRGYLRAGYSPAPSAVLGVGGISWPGDSETDPETYLKYSRTSNVVYSCATIRANMLGGLPLRAYKMGAEPKAGRVLSVREPWQRMGMPLAARGQRLNDARDVTEVEGGKLVTLLRHVNRWWTPRRLIHMTEMSLCLAGQAFWQVDRGEKGNRPPSDLYYVKHTRVDPVRHPAAIIDGWVLDPHTRAQQRLAVDEMVWLRFPDPVDPDYGALSPLAAARLGADTYSASMKSNWGIFANGMSPGGFVLPPEGQVWTDEQLEEAQVAVTQRLAGTEKRHRWLFLPEPFKVQENTLTPREAEFLGGLDFSVEDVARAYGLPIELVGGARRTYQNLENAMRAVWMFTLEPEASFIAAELTEQLVPQFGGEVDFVAFDLSDVTALQEDEAHRWGRAREQIASGAMTINEWRADEGLDTVEWGDVAWLPAGVQPVSSGEPPPQPAGFTLGAQGAPESLGKEAVTAATGGTDGEGRGARQNASDDFPAYGSEAHLRLVRAEDEKVEPHEQAITALLDDLFERQMRSLIDKLGGRGARLSLDDLRRLFDAGRWVREFRTAIRPKLMDAVGAAGGDLFEQIGGGTFDPTSPSVVRAMMAQSQTFAREVNDTTWADLQRTISQGVNEGEALPLLQGRIEGVFKRYLSGSGDSDAAEIAAKISRSEMIARTETTRAWSRGALEAARQNPRVARKRWSSATDSRTRPEHTAAHGQEVGKDEKFTVGGEECECPGDPALSAAQSINCRCRVQYVTGAFVDKPLAVFDDKGNLIPQG